MCLFVCCGGFFFICYYVYFLSFLSPGRTVNIIENNYFLFFYIKYIKYYIYFASQVRTYMK